MTGGATGRSVPRGAARATLAFLVLATGALASSALATGALAGEQGGVAQGQGQGPGPAGAMLARPLFAPTRRPPPPPVSAALQPLSPPAPSPPSGPNVALSGVILGPGGGGVALVRGALDPAPVRVRLGGTVDGWTVAEILPRAVVLRRDGRSATVDLPGAER